MNNLPPALILLAGALLLLVLPRRLRPAAFLLFPLVSFYLVIQLQEGVVLTVPFLGYELMPLRVDRLSTVFAYVFIIIAFIGGVYGFHVKDRLQQVAALLYAGGALGVIFAGDLFTLLVFWELMAVSSVGLIWARRTPRSTRAGMRYLLVHLFGGSVLIAGILMYYSQTGSIAFTHLGSSFASYLILFSFALNAAIPPLHGWLADGYPEGTVTGSVFLSALTTKTAVYTLARGFAGHEILIWAGVIMAIYGVIFAVLENDIRRLLAYHIISQIGYMVAGIGIGTAMALNGATAHAFAHILYKGLLFMGAGAVLYTTGRSKLTELGGLWRAMPLVLGLYMVGAFSISGFPLFSGFVSKSMIIYGADLSHLGWVVLLLNVASVGTFLHTGLKLPYFTWIGRSSGLKPGPVPLGMYLGMGLAAVLCIAIGVFPNLLYNLLPFPVEYHPYTGAHVIETMQILIFTALGFWLLIKKLGGEATVTLDTDWFYRRPQGLAFRMFVDFPAAVFGAVERLGLALTRGVVIFSGNPLGYTLLGANRSLKGGRSRREPAYFKPDRYRISLGIMILVVVIAFSVLVIWNLLS